MRIKWSDALLPPQSPLPRGQGTESYLARVTASRPRKNRSLDSLPNHEHMLQPVVASTSLPPFQASSAFLTSSSPATLEPFREFQIPTGPCQSRTTSGSSSLDPQHVWSPSPCAENGAIDCKPDAGAPVWPPETQNQLWPHDLAAYVPYPYPFTTIPNYLTAGPKAIKCQVCGDESRGRHYGQYTCEACKSFFKRSVRKGAAYICLRGGACDIDARLRNRCRYCRWKRCLAAGMKKQSVQGSRLTTHRSLADDTNLRLPSLKSVFPPYQNSQWPQPVVSNVDVDDVQSYDRPPDNRPTQHNFSLPTPPAPALSYVGLSASRSGTSCDWLQNGPTVEEAFAGDGRRKLHREEVKRLCHANAAWTKLFVESLYVQFRGEPAPGPQSSCFELARDNADFIRLVRTKQSAASSQSLAQHVNQMRCRWPNLVLLSITRIIQESRAGDGDWSPADRSSRTESNSRQFLSEVRFNTPDGQKPVEFAPTGISSSFEDRSKSASVPSTTADSLIKKILNAAALLRLDDCEMPLLKALTLLTSVDFPNSEAQPLASLRQSLEATLFEHVLRRSASHLDAAQRIFALKELVCYLAVIDPRAVLECLGLQELETVS